MSRKKTRPPGRVEFTGLRFFLQKMEGRVSRRELVELVRRFFISRGLKFEVLKVEFRTTRRPSDIIDGQPRSILGRMHYGENRVEVYLGASPHTSSAEVMDTLGHELDHVAWELEGRRFNTAVPYRERPHEKRARRIGARWRRLVEAR